MDHEIEPYIDVRAAAALLGVDPRSVKRYAQTGGLPFYKLGDGRNARMRFKASEVDEWAHRSRSVHIADCAGVAA